MRQITSTISEVRTKETSGDLDIQRKKWISGMEEYASFSSPEFTHPFFGKMTKEQAGYFACKHSDHYWRQFGV